jgi:iron complex transport system ATP-binding protein
MKPDLLLLDEPAAGLDPVAREKFLGKVSRLLRPDSRPLVIYVTHHLEEVLPGFTHVLCLKKGRWAESGKREGVLTPRVLRRIFGAPVELEERGERVWMKPVTR